MHRSLKPYVFAFLALVAPLALGQVDVGALHPDGKKTRPPVQQPSLKPADSPVLRSAQGTCVKEANRRGFAVLDTGNFRQQRDGWSVDLRVRDSRGRVQQGTCYVDTRSGDVDLDGFGWGWDDQGDDQFEFNCSSAEGKYRECQLPVDGQVRLVRQRSDSPCVEGRNWGRRGDRVWVDDGCRARFEVVRRHGGGGAGHTIDCSSDDGRYRECSIGPGRFGRLVREYSNGRCREDRTWGTRNGAVWVTSGCRARFEVRRGNAGGGGYSGGNPGNGGGSGGTSGKGLTADAARRACIAEAGRSGYEAREVSTPFLSADDYRLTMKLRSAAGDKRTVTCRVDRSSGKVKIDQ